MRLLFGMLLLVGCSSPSLKFMKIEPVQVTVEGSVYDVYSNGTEVQAIRINREFLPNKAKSIVRMVMAIEQATGCIVVPTSVDGDQALVKARIKC